MSSELEAREVRRSAEMPALHAEGKSLLGSGHQAVDGADGPVFLVALSQQLSEGEVVELGKLVTEGFGHSIGDGIEIPMGAAERFRNDFIGDTEVDQVFRGHLQGRSSIGNFCRIVPQDGGAAFR